MGDIVKVNVYDPKTAVAAVASYATTATTEAEAAAASATTATEQAAIATTKATAAAASATEAATYATAAEASATSADYKTNALLLSGGSMAGAINEYSATLPSASTMAIGAATGNLIIVSGTTTIAGFDTVQAGTKRRLYFQSALSITYGSSTIVTPGSRDLYVEAGSEVEAISLGSGLWQIYYFPLSKTVYNVKEDFGAKGDGSTDDTTAIQLAFNSVPTGNVLLFSPGTYLHTGLTLAKRINVVGSGKLSTTIKNTGTGDAITISSGIEYGTFRDIAIRGNGTTNYGADATSGNGIVFSNNAVMWDFCNVSVCYHGGFGFYACGNGNVNNIYIHHSQIEYCLGGGVRFIQTNTSNQINAIYIDNCNIAGHGGNGVELWGQSTSVSHCTIQGNKGYGVVFDAELEPGSDGTNNHLIAASIKDNYFEKCNKGFIYARAYYITSTYYRYILGLSIEGNYGTFAKITGDTVTGTISCVEIAAPGWYSYYNYQVAGIVYRGNSFTISDTATYILNCNNVLSWDSVVEINAFSTAIATGNYYVNLGRAKTSFTNLNIPVRNTVITGPVDSTGLPANLSAVSSSLAISELSGSMTTWANGFDEHGQVDYIQLLTSDVTSAWSSLTASSTLYLYKTHGSTTNTITYGFTTIKPIYQDYAPSSPSNGQWYFNTKTMIGYLYSSSSSSWTVTPRVYVGECVTGSSSVTSVTCYAYQGKYKSPSYTTPVAATAVSESHNLGVMPRFAQARLQCITADLGHTVGDEVGSYCAYDGTYMLPIAPTVNRLTIGVTTGSSGLYGVNKSTGAGVALTLADWGYVFEVERGW